MDDVRLIVIGFGNRAGKFLSCFGKGMQLAGIVEPDAGRRDYAVQALGISADICFGSFDALVSSGLKADGAIICSPDKTHFEYASRCLEQGWPVLLEKPIGTTPDECRALAELSARTGIPVTVGYELRYHPYYQKLRELVSIPSLGRLLAVDWAIEVGQKRMTHSFVRGMWSRQEDTGPIALTKLCHDVDMLLWLIPGKPDSWLLEGARTLFRPENAPEGAALRCLDCLVEKGCKFSAVELYLRKHEWIGNFIAKPGESTDEMILRMLRESDFGRCAFHCGNNVNDSQKITLEYPSGARATINMTCSRPEGERTAYFAFENGSIEAGKDTIRLTCGNETREFDYSGIMSLPMHGGADKALLDEFAGSIRNRVKTRSDISSGLLSHLICLSS